MPKLGSWNEKCNKKLLSLLNKGATRGGIGHLNLSKEYIEGTVIAKFFPGRQYKRLIDSIAIKLINTGSTKH